MKFRSLILSCSIAVHQFLVEPQEANALTSSYNLNLCNTGLINPWNDLDISPDDNIQCKIVAIFNDRLFTCFTKRDQNCYSWDIHTLDRETHETFNTEYDWFCYYSVVEVNSKVMVNGGWFHDTPFGRGTNVSETWFLHLNFTWTRGPEMPFKRDSHTSIAINDTIVVIFGGTSAKVWIYDDELMIYTAKKDFFIGLDLTATKIKDFVGLTQDVILVRTGIEMKVYDWEADHWFQLDSSWNMPTEYFYMATLFQADKR